MSRNTVQQKIIAKQLNELCGHPTAEEVYEAVRVDHPAISKATVYRTLNKMAENQQAIKVRVATGADRFESWTTPHCHVVCSVCGRVDDVAIAPFIEGMDQRAAEGAPGYMITGHELRFSGVCPLCQQVQEQVEE